jgi:hypothetical protein
MGVQVESSINAVTREQSTTNALLPWGFIWDLAWEANTKIMCVVTSRLSFEHIRQRFLLFISKIQNSVICWLNFGLTKRKKRELGATGLPISISIVWINRRINNER